jgi:sugar (pentulose or hexulose) kinase
MPDPVVAVFDIGKTNKKLAAYSPTFDVLDERRTDISTGEWHGLETEDTDAMLAWLRDGLASLGSQFDVRAIAISGHGATFGLLDASGELALPVISYTTEQGADVQDEFYEIFGAANDLHRATATADVGFANMAKVLHYIKTRHPSEWGRAKRGLFWAPFFAHALTGKYALEPTFPGNHTYLWDFERGDWSDVARELGADALFQNTMQPSWEPAGTLSESWSKACGITTDCPVTAGVHDSNANLLPYFARQSSEFVLLSTGTWNVTMRPGGSPVLNDEEIRRRIFFNQDVFSRPVRTALMTAGLDYDTFGAFTDEVDAQDFKALAQVVEQADLFVIPGVMPGASAFPNATPSVISSGTAWTLDALQDGAKRFDDLGQAYIAAINLGLAIATADGLSALNLAPGCDVYIEGGFAKNDVFCRILAGLCTNLSISVSAETEGTSLGAAMTGWMLADGAGLETIGANYKATAIPVEGIDSRNLSGYRERFIRHVTE